MGNIAHRIKEWREEIAKASNKISSCHAHIEELQESCPHNWVFNRQDNNFHENEWNVTYKCPECYAERTDKGIPPMCEICDLSLKRAQENDTEAKDELKKKKHQGHYNPPIAFRCTQCKKIHILWINGD